MKPSEVPATVLKMERNGGIRALQFRSLFDTLWYIDIFWRHLIQEYKAVIKQEGEWWYGWIEEVPGINCQERSKEELLETLRTTLREAIELNRQESRRSASSEFTEVRIAI